MATAYSIVRTEIQDIVQDSVFASAGSMFKYLLIWTNRVQRNVHKSIDFRHKLSINTKTVSFTGSSPVSMPTDFFKASNRFLKARQNAAPDEVIPIMGLDRLLAIDHGQNDTTSSAFPDAVAIEGGNMYSTPLFTGTVDIEGYYTIPTDVSADGDNLDFPDDDDATELIVAGVARRCFAYLKDPEMANYYTTEFVRLLELLRLHTLQSDSELILKAPQF